MKAYDIKIRLDKVRPIHWRDLIVPAEITFDDIYYIVQIVFGFKHNHDYKFTFKDSDIVIEGMGEGIPITYMEELDDYVLSISYNLGSEFELDGMLGNYKKIKLEIHTRENWQFSIEIKKIIESEFDYPIVKRFKGDYNPVGLGCGKYEFMDMLHLLEHPEDKDNEEFSRAEAYLDDLTKFDMDKTQEILKHSFENYFTSESNDDDSDEAKRFPYEPTTMGLIDSTLHEATLIGENDYGSVYLHEEILDAVNKPKVVFIIGMNPLESKAYRAVFESLDFISIGRFVSYKMININFSNKYVDEEIGEKLVEDFVIPHILKNDYDLIVDVHSNINEKSDEPHNFIFSPSDDEKSVDILKNIKSDNILKQYVPNSWTNPHYIQSIIDGEKSMLYLKTDSYEPISLTYTVVNSLINVISDYFY